jgi:hypothetical protein
MRSLAHSRHAAAAGRGGRGLIGLLAALALLAVLMASSAQASPLDQIRIPFSGTVAGPAGETVAVEADLRVTVRIDGDEAVIRATVVSATAIGQTTGARYTFSGSDRVVIPISRLDEPIELTFQLKPPGGERRTDVSAAFFLSIE